jgi:hypothetical protein
LAFTALVVEKTSFFALGFGMRTDLLGEVQRTPDGRLIYRIRDEKNASPGDGDESFVMLRKEGKGVFLNLGWRR